MSGACASLLPPPEARRVELVETLHGHTVADPYRWMESSSPELDVWIAAQNERTRAFLDEAPERERFLERLTAIWQFERAGVPVRKGSRLFFLHNPGSLDQSRLVTSALDGSDRRTLYDPSSVDPDGTTAIGTFSPSEDGQRVAFAIARAGSDWNTVRVLDATTGRLLDDELGWVKFTALSWAQDGSGFWYSRYPAPPEGDALSAPNKHHQVYFHRVGTHQADDTLVYARDDEPDWGFGAEPTRDGRYLVFFVSRGADRKNGLLLRDLARDDALVQPFVGLDFSASFDVISSDGDRFLIRTDAGAPGGRIVEIDVASPAPEQWRTVVPEQPEALEAATRVGDRLVCQYLRDAVSVIKVHGLDGSPLGDVALPALGSAEGFSGSPTYPEGYFLFTNFLTPGRILRFDPERGVTPLIEPSVPSFNPERFVVGREMAVSRDGTRVPLFVVHRRDLVLDGSAPAYLYGYGGFNISVTPWFSPGFAVWLEEGGVLAIPNLRGGGEFGEAWHQGGMKGRKQNVFDDFIASAELLIAKGYTRSDRLAIGGGSNGGLLVGAVMTQRPELAAAALPAVGVLDMLRFHKFTIGWAWTSEYGSPDEPDDFRHLLAYSPYHRIEAGKQYPATLVLTADHDDRVVPSHSFKFTARLQELQGGSAPILIRVDTRAGHGAGKSARKLAVEWADRLAFLALVLGRDDP
ncbi:MAG: S9 family peptidase [Myxococcales bacterium]|nr:S9 family peptidase [Myxococcales bacterium]